MSFETPALPVESLAYGGDGVAHLDGRVIFIPDALPGDVVRTRTVQDKGSYLRGELLDIVEPSPDRVEPFCPFADRCGGCQWQRLAYPAQLRWKRAIVEESLRRIGHIENVTVEDCIPSPEDRGYRTVMRFPARRTASGPVMGYYGRRSHTIVDIPACPLGGERANGIAGRLRAFPEFAALDLREVTIRAGHNHPSSLVSILLGRQARFDALAGTMLREIETLAGVAFHQETTPDRSRRLKVFGEPYRHETVLEKTFRIEERSFFQINIPQTENLVHLATEMGELADGQRLVDGYGGAGLFSLSIAPPDTPVFLFDLAPPAVEDAVHNAAVMGFRNFTAFTGDAKEAFSESGTAERLIVDPPRTGLGMTAAGEMCRFGAERIVSISCNPTTLARDLRYFIEQGYRLERIVPVDMFPHTYHIETVAVLSREENNGE